MLYYHFREINWSSGPSASLIVHDRGAHPSVNDNGHVMLAANGVPVALRLPRSAWPDVLASSLRDAAMFLKVDLSDLRNALEPSGLWTEPLVRFECVDHEGRRLSPTAVFALPLGSDLPIPEIDNIVRVAGRQQNQRGFDVSGACWYVALLDLYERYAGAALDHSARVLDWGCGCGRIARFLLRDGYQNLFGIDIDPMNIEWCNEHIHAGTFELCDFDPPTRFGDGSFDLIYAHSVFTHLEERSEAIWLEELNRLLAPGGIACVTVKVLALEPGFADNQDAVVFSKLA